MNKTIKLAVAGAVLALSASANAGILIPAGDWTLDVSGNVNSYMQSYRKDGTATIQSALSIDTTAGKNTAANFGNGLLPNFISIGGSTRQNDLDVSFVISLQPGGAANTPIGTADSGINNRQSSISFGDKSWGSILIGKNLGIFGSDAILSDMTLLGVGALGTGGNTTLGRIGYGYIYADWKPQIAYTTPNMNGFQATVGVSQAFTASSRVTGMATTTALLAADAGANGGFAYEGKASYSFAANDVTGKIWAEGISQKVGQLTQGTTIVNNSDSVTYGGGIGANVGIAGFGLTGYYYGGQGIGTMGQQLDGFGGASTAAISARDSDGGYIQGTYVLPTKTKLGVSWGISKLDLAANETSDTISSTATMSAGKSTLIKENEMTTVGLYHPLTKHLNLVGEFNYLQSQNHAGEENKAYSSNLGAILFF